MWQALPAGSSFCEVIMFKVQSIAACAGLSGLLVSGFASAALDPAITAAATTTGVDAAALGGLVLVLIVGISIFKHLRSAK